MNLVKFKDHLDRILNTKEEDLFNILFVVDSECSSCQEFKDTVTNELDVNLWSNVEFSLLDTSLEVTPFMPIAVPSMIVHYKGTKFIETYELPLDSRGFFSSAGLEELISLCINERKKF